jgi:hypothetical protein
MHISRKGLPIFLAALVACASTTPTAKQVEPTYCTAQSFIPISRTPELRDSVDDVIRMALTDNQWDKSRGGIKGAKYSSENLYVFTALQKSQAFAKFLADCSTGRRLESVEKVLVTALSKAPVSDEVKKLGKPRDKVPYDGLLLLK